MASYWQSDPPRAPRIPVARPRLPSFEQIAPYLRRIDVAQWYSNGGPLARELETRLAGLGGHGEAKAALVVNATLGLTLALLAQDLPPGSLCMVPSWTFAATAHAIELAGLVPWIVDVDPETWALEAAAARELIGDAPAKVTAVIPVSPFGAPMNPSAWESFRDETGIVVVIDAAASFDTFQASTIPTVVSLHATKLLGAGEGGFIITTEAMFAEEIEKRANFGFWNSREARVQSLNGKVSEYTAAAALAALDEWVTIRKDFARVACTYKESLASQSRFSLQPGLGESWVSSTMMLRTARGQADAVAEALAAQEIGSRRWWGGGLHRHRAFATAPRHDVTQTELLADTTIGLPCWRDLPDENITEICDIVRSVSE